MDMRGRFLRLVVIAAIGLGVVLIVQIGMDLTIPLTEGEIGYFNLLVDVIVGGFTVLGLYWVASELALRPELDLSIAGLDGSLVLEGECRRHRTVVKCRLYLTNARPKAARFIRIVLFVCSVPALKYFHGQCVHHDGERSIFYRHQEGEGLLGYSVQYPENFGLQG